MTQSYHRWTEADVETLRTLSEQRVPLAEIAEIIGSTPASCAVRRSDLGISLKRTGCVCCGKRLRNQKQRGRKRQFCSPHCSMVMARAHLTNERIDARTYTHCLNCNGRLIPPWTSKKKWCSRRCGHRGWYESAYYGTATGRRKMIRRSTLAMARRGKLNELSPQHKDWLRTIRAEGDAPAHRVRRLRELLGLADKRALIRYARAVSIAALT